MKEEYREEQMYHMFEQNRRCARVQKAVLLNEGAMLGVSMMASESGQFAVCIQYKQEKGFRCGPQAQALEKGQFTLKHQDAFGGDAFVVVGKLQRDGKQVRSPLLLFVTSFWAPQGTSSNEVQDEYGDSTGCCSIN